LSEHTADRRARDLEEILQRKPDAALVA
jgi:hypothetical protein